MSVHVEAMAYIGETFGNFALYFFFLTTPTMAQENMNYLYNTKEVLVSVSWDNIVSDHGVATS